VRAEAAISLVEEHGFSYLMAFSVMLLGWALAQQGQAKEGIEQLTHGLSAFLATGNERSFVDKLCGGTLSPNWVHTG
jgi:hypothetical protein